jgi:cytochrome oxidase Cu insertion factor (SCO1/SenC/PrrC family)
MSSTIRIYVFFVSIGILAAVLMWVGKTFLHYTATPSNSSLAEITDKGSTGLPHIGGSFSLIDHHGNLRTDADFKGKYMVIYFGYSFCPDICPAALSNITEALNQLGGKAEQIYPLFVTIDPQRDTVEHLARYISIFHPRFIALTGTSEEIEKAKKAYRVYGNKVKAQQETTDYVMDHSSIVYVMDRQGRFVAHFNHTTPPDEIVRIMNTLI